jgi:two-component system, NarL family, response regulator NreC
LGKLRILIGDDHTLMRQGLRKILEERPDWEIVAEAGDGRTVVRDTLALAPDIAVLDIGMPLLNGIEATAQITRKAPDVSVLILSMHADEAYVTQAVRAGARGYLLKDAAGSDLIGAITALAAGKSFFWKISRSRSESEREIFQLVAEGHSTKEIAELLSVSPATVETHRAHILHKLDIHNTAELVRYAVRRGVIS